jgi:23S rRNA G2069 N7-methylase RlmK/C1962 C5-methylase RlmI
MAALTAFLSRRAASAAPRQQLLVARCVALSSRLSFPRARSSSVPRAEDMFDLEDSDNPHASPRRDVPPPLESRPLPPPSGVSSRGDLARQRAHVTAPTDSAPQRPSGRRLSPSDVPQAATRSPLFFEREPASKAGARIDREAPAPNPTTLGERLLQKERADRSAVKSARSVLDDAFERGRRKASSQDSSPAASDRVRGDTPSKKGAARTFEPDPARTVLTTTAFAAAMPARETPGEVAARPRITRDWADPVAKPTQPSRARQTPADEVPRNAGRPLPMFRQQQPDAHEARHSSRGSQTRAKKDYREPPASADARIDFGTRKASAKEKPSPRSVNGSPSAPKAADDEVALKRSLEHQQYTRDLSEEERTEMVKRMPGCVVLRSGHSGMFRAGNTNVFDSAIESVSGASAAGDLVRVQDSRGVTFGWGMYFPGALIRVRVLARVSEPLFIHWPRGVPFIISERIYAAQRLRRALFLPNQTTNVYRLFHGAGDGLDGLAIDVFGHKAVVMSGSLWCELFRTDIEAAIFEAGKLRITEIIWRRIPDRLRSDGWTPELLAGVSGPAGSMEVDGGRVNKEAAESPLSQPPVQAEQSGDIATAQTSPNIVEDTLHGAACADAFGDRTETVDAEAWQRLNDDIKSELAREDMTEFGNGRSDPRAAFTTENGESDSAGAGISANPSETTAEIQGDSETLATSMEIPRDIVREFGVKYLVSPGHGQKTGHFCDQRENRLLVRTLVRSGSVQRVLDLYSYTGGFALNAGLGGAKHVLGVESNAWASAVARENSRLNALAERVKFLRSNAVRFMDAQIKSGQLDEWDLIIVDPPKLAASARHLTAALHHYRHINELAIRLVRSGGFVLTFSCSAAVSSDDFLGMLRQAGQRVGRTMSVVQARGAAVDHPTNPHMREVGQYLTGVLLRIV